MDKREYLREWNKRNQDKVKATRARNRERRNARQRELYASSPERRRVAKAYVAAYKKKHPYYATANRYKIDADRLELLTERGCMICGAGWAPGISVRMHVDHDHKTGKVRGVLCGNCNLGIGKFYEDPMLLHAAIEYLAQSAA